MAKRPNKKAHPLYLNPEGKLKDFDCGVLRASYNGKTNTTVAYAEGKLRLCVRAEVLLPADASDALASPVGLWRSYEAARLPGQRDLATSVTLYLTDARALHTAWEEVRAFARAEFADRAGLPVLAVLHAPGLAGSSHDVHAHLVVAARRLHSWGWGRFSDLCRDSAQHEIHSAWVAHRRQWQQE